jgi:hypothetical protein
VGDEEDFRFISIAKIKQILKDQSFEFVEARDGEEALALLKRGVKPSMIILDYTLPKINGIELLRRIDSDHGDLILPVYGSETWFIMRLRASLLPDFSICRLMPPYSGHHPSSGHFFVSFFLPPYPMARRPDSPVRMRMHSSSGTMKILPSPMLPVRAPSIIASSVGLT